MSLEMLIMGGAFGLGKAGATPKRRNGLARRSARGLRAGQSGRGVSREAGRAYCFHAISRIWTTPAHQGPGPPTRRWWAVVKKQAGNVVSDAERNAKARETGRGSLSIPIVAIESRVTIPREPVSSQGGCRGCGPGVSNTNETQRSWKACQLENNG